MKEIKINSKNKPPVGGMGGSIHDWERGIDPFHIDCFPEEFKSFAPNKTGKKDGWLGLDWCGNVITFVPDGYIWKN